MIVRKDYLNRDCLLSLNWFVLRVSAKFKSVFKFIHSEGKAEYSILKLFKE